jgi:polar amino acid transport system permease protein
LPEMTRITNGADRVGINAEPVATTRKRVRKRHYGRGAAYAVVLVLAALALMSVVTNPRYEWDVVGEYLFDDTILDGVRVTLMVTAVAMVIGTLLGVVLAAMAVSGDRMLKSFAVGWLWLFRGVPLLVQLVFWFNIAAVYPEISLGIPNGPGIFLFEGNSVSPLMAAIVGLSLHESAYMAEVIRGGILSVGRQQVSAALSVGMTEPKAFMRITLPQSLRVIAPATGNQVILMLKTTTLVSVIALGDVLYAAQTIAARNFQIIPLLIVASIWYLAIVSVLSVAQHFIERRLGRGYGTTGGARVRKGAGAKPAEIVPSALIEEGVR